MRRCFATASPDMQGGGAGTVVLCQHQAMACASGSRHPSSCSGQQPAAEVAPAGAAAVKEGMAAAGLQGARQWLGQQQQQQHTTMRGRSPGVRLLVCAGVRERLSVPAGPCAACSTLCCSTLDEQLQLDTSTSACLESTTFNALKPTTWRCMVAYIYPALHQSLHTCCHAAGAAVSAVTALAFPPAEQQQPRHPQHQTAFSASMHIAPSFIHNPSSNNSTVANAAHAAHSLQRQGAASSGGAAAGRSSHGPNMHQLGVNSSSGAVILPSFVPSRRALQQQQQYKMQLQQQAAQQCVSPHVPAGSSSRHQQRHSARAQLQAPGGSTTCAALQAAGPPAWPSSSMEVTTQQLPHRPQHAQQPTGLGCAQQSGQGCQAATTAAMQAAQAIPGCSSLLAGNRRIASPACVAVTHSGPAAVPDVLLPTAGGSTNTDVTAAAAGRVAAYSTCVKPTTTATKSPGGAAHPATEAFSVNAASNSSASQQQHLQERPAVQAAAAEASADAPQWLLQQQQGAPAADISMQSDQAAAAAAAAKPDTTTGQQCLVDQPDEGSKGGVPQQLTSKAKTVAPPAALPSVQNTMGMLFCAMADADDSSDDE